MNLLLRLTLSVLAAALPLTVPCHAGESADRWKPVEKPEELGWSSSRLAALKAHTDRLGTAALMILTDGRVVHAHGDIDKRFLANSMRKSFMSALYGIYIARG